MQELTRASAPTLKKAKSRPILDVIRAPNSSTRELSVAVNALTMPDILEWHRSYHQLQSEICALRETWRNLKKEQRRITAPHQNRSRPNSALSITPILHSWGIKAFAEGDCCPCIALNVHALVRNKRELKTIEAKGKELKKHLEQVTKLKSLAELRVEDYDQAIDDLKFLLLRFDDAFNLKEENKLSEPQSERLAIGLLEKFPGLTIEDVALCLNEIEMGKRGTIYRLDAATIGAKLQEYQSRKNELWRQANENEYLAHKYSNQPRQSQPDEKKEEEFRQAKISWIHSTKQPSG